MFQLMPHAGPRVVSDLLDALAEMGAGFEKLAPRELYPEAASDLEADMLGVLAGSASEAAVDRLLMQPRVWRRWLDDPDWAGVGAIVEASDVLDRLVRPATVVVVGRANVGKSTLTNRLAGRRASVVADLPGTTRDWVGSLVELYGKGAESGRVGGGVAVRWLDTPGVREAADGVELEAIRLAEQVIREADVLIGMRDPRIGWLERCPGGRKPDIRVVNKIDTVESTSEPDASVIGISAQTGEGVSTLEQAIIDVLRFGGIPAEQPWAFTQELREILVSGDIDRLRRYTGVRGDRIVGG